MELLAPAGNVDNFYAAVRAGADAVYVGAPAINARNLGRDLTYEDITVLIDYAHARGKKLYIAANSLLLERDLPLVFESLAIFSELQPDALIVQDPSLISLTRKYFPHLRLHASTLAGCSNSESAAFFKHLGCDRVVLARELTLGEIGQLAESSDIELEVFVHGAMCYSFSGLCLFSSYLGGKSGLRGRCVQPCRRDYRWEEKISQKKPVYKAGRKHGKYLFSMNDLNGLSAIRVLKKYNIASIKLEGRMRSMNYVKNIVSAYRLAIDNDSEQALKEAEELVHAAMGRNTSSGYYYSNNPQDAIIPHHSGNMGTHLGTFRSIVEKSGKTIGKILLKCPVATGDRLRLHLYATGERKAFTLRSIYIAGRPEKHAETDKIIQIEIPFPMNEKFSQKVDLYKVDGAEEKNVHQHAAEVKKQRARFVYIFKSAKETAKNLYEKTYQDIRSQRKGFPPIHQQKRKGRGAQQQLDIWLKTDYVPLIIGELPFFVSKYIIPLDKKTINQSVKIKQYLGKGVKNIIWALPPVQFERDIRVLIKNINRLERQGFRNFQISHISQYQFFWKRKVFLYGDYTLNIANSYALYTASTKCELSAVQASIELDRDGFSDLAAGCSRLLEPRKQFPLLGVTIYGAPPLFTSRLNPSFFDYKKSFRSPKDESFFLVRQGSMVLTIPKRPFSLLSFTSDFRDMGYDYGVIDVCNTGIGVKEMQWIANQLSGKSKKSVLPSFNYTGRLE